MIALHQCCIIINQTTICQESVKSAAKGRQHQFLAAILILPRMSENFRTCKAKKSTAGEGSSVPIA